jgi:hypothetical protein
MTRTHPPATGCTGWSSTCRLSLRAFPRAFPPAPKSRASDGRGGTTSAGRDMADRVRRVERIGTSSPFTRSINLSDFPGIRRRPSSLRRCAATCSPKVDSPESTHGAEGRRRLDAAREPRRPVPPLSPPRRLARRIRPSCAPPVPRREILEPAAARVWKPAVASPDRRSRSRRSRRKPDRPHFHGRRVGKLPVSGDSRRRALQPAGIGSRGRRPRALRCPSDGSGEVRASR